MQERLQKIIARAGIASRRHAEDLIRSGQVRVNGVVVTELGSKADPMRDRVEAAGKVARLSDARVYLLMNKPPDVVSTLADPEGRRTLRNFLVGVSERVFPVGRLDYAASGAIFLTNDGDFASKMLKASPSLPQAFWIKVKGRVSDVQLKSLSHMVDGKIFPLRGTHAAGKNPPNPRYEAQMNGGRREILRRNLLAIGHPVEKIRRMKLATLDADSVQEGHYRQLSAEEVAKLGRAIDRALTEHKPVPKGFKPRREWRPRAEILAQKKTVEKRTVGTRPAAVDKRSMNKRPMTHSKRPTNRHR
jgi:23S rRNA pseudouridine2605 synthase